MPDDRKKKDPGAVSPWLKGVTSVSGVVPPGRRLSPSTERRATDWSASGVKGVRPPGKLTPGEGPAVESALKAEKKRLLREKANKRAKEEATAKGARGRLADPQTRRSPASFDPGRPIGAFQPDPFADLGDPADFKTFLEGIADFIKTLELTEDACGNLAELITQSHAPYEIAVAFTVLSAAVGKNAALRKRFTPALERGAKTFFNLAGRLSPSIKPPRGLKPDSMNAIFHDLPPSAYQVPYAFASDAFAWMIELLGREPDMDRKLVAFAIGLRKRYIDRRAIGDRALADLFPWTAPRWGREEE